MILSLEVHLKISVCRTDSKELEGVIEYVQIGSWR